MPRYFVVQPDGHTFTLESYDPRGVLSLQGREWNEPLKEENLLQYEDWINAGGVEIIFEVVRGLGWIVDIDTEEEEAAWGSDVIADASGISQAIFLNPAKSAFEQAASVVEIAVNHFSRPEHRGYPIFRDSDMTRLLEENSPLVRMFFRTVKDSSEAAVAMMCKASRA